jgi:hypothetical protein
LPGYELTWAEYTSGASSTINDQDTNNVFSGSYSLETFSDNSSNDYSYVTYYTGDARYQFYIRFAFRLNNTEIQSGEYFNMMAITPNSFSGYGGDSVFDLTIKNESGTLNLYVEYYDGISTQSVLINSVSLSTWYILEAEWDGVTSNGVVNLYDSGMTFINFNTFNTIGNNNTYYSYISIGKLGPQDNRIHSLSFDDITMTYS